MPTDQQDPPGQKTLEAPDGCGFMDMPVLPVQIHLMCQKCEAPMPCVAQVPPLLVAATPGPPPMPDYLHQCLSCEKKVRMKQPFPTIRYAPHPTFAVATSEQEAELAAQQAAAEETREQTTSPLTETPSASSSEEE